MFGSIDCAGILKLRNADIELRKGETDIGRKNTRVRLVFRVHIPESNGRIISLQAASNPIECCKYPLRFAPSLSLATVMVLSLCSRLALKGGPQGAQIGKYRVLCSALAAPLAFVPPFERPAPPTWMRSLETSFDGRWLFTVLRACEDSAGLQGLCKVYLLVWCCWVFLNSRSLLGAGSQCGCAYRGRYTFSLFVHERASCLPS